MTDSTDDQGILHVSSHDLRGRGREDAAGDWAHYLLDALATEGFYGDVTFQFQNGQPYLARRQETLKPKDE